MKILLITTLYPGYENQSRKEMSYALHYFAKDWIEAGHEVQVVKIWPYYPAFLKLFNKAKQARKYKDDYNFNLEGILVQRIGIIKYPLVNYFTHDIKKVFKKVLREFNGKNEPDIIVCHFINPTVYIGELLKKRWSKPLILTLHKTDVHKLMKENNRLKVFLRTLPSIDKIAFRSEVLKKKFDSLKLPVLSDHIIYSGIEEKLIIDDFILNTKVKKKSQIILVAANMITLKNIDIVIKAFDKISQQKEVILKIAGDGIEKEKLVNLAGQLKANDKISFLGYLSREEVMENMEKSDIFVQVSAPETFGLVYLEAMAKGCITIGSEGEGIDGVIINEKNGFLCVPRDIEELVKVFSRILTLENNEKEKILVNAVHTAKKMTQENMSKNYLTLLEKTIIDQN